MQGPYHGSILAYELDPLNNNDIESVYQENDIEEEWKDKIDNLFIIDEKLNMYKVQIIRKESIVINRFNLNDKPLIKQTLENKVRDKDFVRLGISDRCLSIAGKIFNIKTGYGWDVHYQGSQNAVESDKNVLQVQNITFSHQ